MDMEKRIWKMKYRLKKIKGVFQLLACNFRIRHGLLGEVPSYYYMQRDMLRELIHDDVEEAYLDYHGLLPEEPEPEPQPEPEKEPGLIRRLELIELAPYSVMLGDDVYCLTEVKEYEDRTAFIMQVIDGNYEIRELSGTMPHRPGERFDAFVLEEERWRWDRVDARLCFCPVVQETAEERAAAQPVRALQGYTLRVDKALAEERLSSACLDYAYQSSDAGYDWCISDHSHYPVLYELQMAATEEAERELRKELSFYCLHYWKESGLGG